MVTNTKKKVIYKSALAVLLGGTMLTGCGNSEESTKDKEEVTENNKTTEANVENNLTEKTCESMEPDIMTPEETNALTEGQVIKPQECKQLPDAAVLEAKNLAYGFIYTMSVPTESGVVKDRSVSATNIEQYLLDRGLNPEDSIDYYEFDGIQILPVVEYYEGYNENDPWLKVVVFEGKRQVIGSVVTEEKLKELNGNQ